MKSSEFMRALPDAVRPKLNRRLRDFETAGRAWLAQFYYDDPRVHYEVWNLGPRRGRLEIGLHLESRDRELNARLLDGMFSPDSLTFQLAGFDDGLELDRRQDRHERRQPLDRSREAPLHPAQTQLKDT